MKKYDKDVVERRFRKRRKTRKSTTGQPPIKYLNLFLGIFAIGAALVLAIVIIYLMDWGF